MILHYDSPDRYGPHGSIVDVVAPNAYALNNCTIRGEQARTGRTSFGFGPSNTMRKSLGGAFNRVGFGFGLYMPSLPTRRVQFGFSMLDVFNSQILTLAMGVTGKLYATTGNGATPVGDTDREVAPGSWNHIEFATTRHATLGELEIRVNEKVFLQLDHLNTSPTGIDISQIYIGPVQAGQADFSGLWFVDDVEAWEADSGLGACDFLGMNGVYNLRPISDIAPQDWDRTSGATSFPLVGELDQDGDLNYLFSDTTGDQTRLEVENLPAEVETVAAVKPYALVRKTTTGPGDISMSVESNSTLQECPDFTTTTTYGYSDVIPGAIIELDPDTVDAWNPTAMPNIQIERKL